MNLELWTLSCNGHCHHQDTVFPKPRVPSVTVSAVTANPSSTAEAPPEGPGASCARGPPGGRSCVPGPATQGGDLAVPGCRSHVAVPVGPPLGVFPCVVWRHSFFQAPIACFCPNLRARSPRAATWAGGHSGFSE